MRNLIEEARICHGEHTTHGKFIQELADHAEGLEAKLAKAVGALRLARDAINGLTDSGDAFDDICTTIAELTGGKDA